MEILQIREAKASFSALVAAAEKGRPTLVLGKIISALRMAASVFMKLL